MNSLHKYLQDPDHYKHLAEVKRTGIFMFSPFKFEFSCDTGCLVIMPVSGLWCIMVYHDHFLNQVYGHHNVGYDFLGR